jgi:hypothetical protein
VLLVILFLAAVGYVSSLFDKKDNKGTEAIAEVEKEAEAVKKEEGLEVVSTTIEDPKTKTVEPNDTYEIIYSIKKRYDGGISYYVLLEPIDFSNANFIDNVKKIVNKLVEENGERISIEFFDDRDVLELSYKEYGDLTLDRTLTEEENQRKAIHYTAVYSGELETGLYLNTLYLFPSAFADHPEVGRFVDSPWGRFLRSRQIGPREPSLRSRIC